MTHLEVLLIENDPASARLTKEAFKDVGLHESVKAVQDGEEALAYLQQSKKIIPDIIFLDLHLPKKSGMEVLKELKGNRMLSVIPVVVVSGSSDPAEIREAYELHASCFVHKPQDLEQLLHFIRTCYEFWGAVVTLPPKS